MMAWPGNTAIMLNEKYRPIFGTKRRRHAHAPQQSNHVLSEQMLVKLERKQILETRL